MDKLPVYFGPAKNEILHLWLSRLAHQNCISESDLFNCKDHSYEFKNFLYPALVEKSTWINADIENTSTFKHIRFEGVSSEEFFCSRAIDRYCPNCFNEDEQPYFRKEWGYPWITHCTMHKTPLLSNCWRCGTWISYAHYNWEEKWAHCKTCNESLASNFKNPPDLLFSDNHNKSVLTTLNLIESSNDSSSSKEKLNELSIITTWVHVYGIFWREKLSKHNISVFRESKQAPGFSMERLPYGKSLVLALELLNTPDTLKKLQHANIAPIVPPTVQIEYA